MDFGALEKIFDIEFSPTVDLSDITINIVDYDGGDSLQKSGQDLDVNISEMSPEQLSELGDALNDHFYEQGRVLQQDAEIEAATIESGYSEEDGEVTDYFDGILTDRYLGIIDQSLHLKAVIDQKDLSRDEIHERKRDIAERYGVDAMYLSSLATSGYFHPNGGLRDLYVTMGLDPDYDRLNFQQELEDLVKQKILCVFIENDQDVAEVAGDVEGRLARFQRVDPVHEWLDIRGIGQNCERTIDSVVGGLEERYEGIDYSIWNNDRGNRVVRIRPHTLPPLE